MQPPPAIETSIPPSPSRGPLSPAVQSARKRSYTTLKSPTAIVKTSSVWPPPEQAAKYCSCDAKYLHEQFANGPIPDLDFHTYFFGCSMCPKRPVDRVCCKCWKGFCTKHSAEHCANDPAHHVFVNYEIWVYEHCFSCLRCNGYVANDGVCFDNILEPLFTSKGSFVTKPITDKHCEVFATPRAIVGAATMQGWRSDNEDSHCVSMGLPNFPHLDLYAVFDGHGGPRVARFLGGKIVTAIEKELTAMPGKPMEAVLHAAFMALDDKLMSDGGMFCKLTVRACNGVQKHDSGRRDARRLAVGNDLCTFACSPLHFIITNFSCCKQRSRRVLMECFSR